ncbi:UNVERIFIED_CONTAM: hypothetical protein GTU68_000393 [Idotea baltica]|nr:hypothetical protein [Idotea baltica]
MWSGPRNISTAMMRAWENRSDCVVVDEAFYAYFLKHTGIDHPMADQIIESHESNVDKVIELVSTPPAKGVFYQKHISTHMLEHIPLDWLAQVQNLFLIRDPRYMVASYTAKRDSNDASDLGYTQLETLFNAASSLPNQDPLVIDSRRFLEQPEAHLRYICKHLNIEFESSMLNWPAGTRASDGVWHAHWYDSVKTSTGFGAPRTELPKLTNEQQALADECMPHFEALNRHALIL